ncbi:hypothetical protein GTO10_01325 [Candidatus Saccharibacteria bacterium]|nr:hypothetical protein [Candidatus Saccharibacteria bacterium]
MTKVSRKRTSIKQEKRLQEQFFENLNSLSEGERWTLLSALFTPTEIRMFSKRLAALKLLYGGKSYREISKALNLTPTAINRLSNLIHRSGKGLQQVVEKLK